MDDSSGDLPTVTGDGVEASGRPDGAVAQAPISARPCAVPITPSDAAHGLEFSPALLERFQLIRLLGRGGMGIVYLMRDRRLDRLVAVKMLAARTTSAEDAGRLEREARAVAALNHTNIVTIHDVAWDQGHPYMVCEFVEGQTLGQCLGDFLHAPLERALEAILQILCGLAVAHEIGIVHRDLKPANVLVRSDGVIKLADFGLASSERLGGNGSFGRFPGTPAYMSPEQCSGRPVTPASDLYAVGLILFEMLTSQRPFCGPSQNDYLEQHLTVEPPDISELRDNLPPALVAVVRRLLAKDPLERPGTARGLASEIQAIRAGLSVPPPRSAAVASGPRGSRAIVALAGACLAILLLWNFFRRPPLPWPPLNPPPHPGDRTTASAALARARERVAAGQARAAEEQLQAASAADGSWDAPHLERGQLALQTHRTALARAEFQTAALLGPQPAAALVGYGRALLQEDKPDQALEVLHIALGHDHENARAHTWLAEALFRTGSIQEARRELEHAERFDPHLADVHLVAGHICEHQHELAAAAQEYRNALELDPKNPEATQHLVTLSDRKPVP